MNGKLDAVNLASCCKPTRATGVAQFVSAANYSVLGTTGMAAVYVKWVVAGLNAAATTIRMRHVMQWKE